MFPSFHTLAAAKCLPMQVASAFGDSGVTKNAIVKVSSTPARRDPTQAPMITVVPNFFSPPKMGVLSSLDELAIFIRRCPCFLGWGLHENQVWRKDTSSSSSTTTFSFYWAFRCATPIPLLVTQLHLRGRMG
mmetsp:Transcript_8864/g.14370  ORF Transcript_8864/g.14370 Transcript_8864/m.14370 type:complete len:132 (+) Transcript_8864:1535-1930(+)